MFFLLIELGLSLSFTIQLLECQDLSPPLVET